MQEETNISPKIPSSIKQFSVNGSDYSINLGDPGLHERIKEWEQKRDELAIPKDGAVTTEKYEHMALFVKDMIGEEQYLDIFGYENRDIFLLIHVIIEIGTVFEDFHKAIDILNKRIAENELIRSQNAMKANSFDDEINQEA